MANYSAVYPVIARQEGSRGDAVLSRADGVVKYGVTLQDMEDFPNKYDSPTVADLRALTRKEAKAIYKELYWDPIQGSRTPEWAAIVMLDAAVLQGGPYQSILWMQKALNEYLVDTIDEDGIMGPQTRGALDQVAVEGYIEDVAETYMSLRLARLRAAPRWDEYGDAWSERISRVHGVAMDTAEETAEQLQADERLEVPAKTKSKEPNWLKLARGELGVKEIPGPGSNSRVEEYHDGTNVGGSDDDVPWCSSFVNFVITEAGYAGTNNAAARSWLQWGKEVTEKVGAIAVFKRGNSNWQGHVGFIVDWDEDYLYILGGNQSNEVNITPYPRSKLLGIRWPKTMKDSSNVKAAGVGGISVVTAGASVLADKVDEIDGATETAGGILTRVADVLQYPMVPWVLLAVALGAFGWVVLTRHWRFQRVND